jgi:hypothetical protein
LVLSPQIRALRHYSENASCVTASRAADRPNRQQVMVSF